MSVILMNHKPTNSQVSEIVSYDKGDDLSSLVIVMLGDKTMSPPTVSMNKVHVMKITKSDLADKQSKNLYLTSCFDACSVTHRLGRPRVGLACPADLACSVTVIRVHLQSSRGCTGLDLSVEVRGRQVVPSQSRPLIVHLGPHVRPPCIAPPIFRCPSFRNFS